MFGGFGSQQAPAFGAAPQTTQPSGFGFGAAPAAQPQTTQGSGFAGFGQANQTTTSGFGSTPAFGAQPAATGFGAAPTSQAPAFGAATNQPAGGLFGQPQQATTSLFGNTAAATQAPSLFGAKPATTTSFGFGAPAVTTTTGGFGQTTSPFGVTQPQQQQQQTTTLFGAAPVAAAAPQQSATILDSLGQIKEQWNPQNPQCQFKHFLYNMVHPSEVGLYVKPPNVDDALWNQAQLDNPDPSCMVPVLAVGFDDLKKRMDEQQRQCQVHRARLVEINKDMDELFKKHNLQTLVKMEEYKRRHMQHIQRVMTLMRKVHVLRNKGYSVRAEEENIKAKLEQMSQEVSKPTVFKGRANELAAQLQQYLERDRASISYEIADEQALRAIFQTLSDTQAGLQCLLETIDSDRIDAEKLKSNYAQLV